MSLSLRRSDRVALSPGIRAVDGRLVNSRTGGEARLNASASESLALIDGERPLGEIASEIASRHRVGEQRVWADLAGLMAELDRFALLEIRRRPADVVRDRWESLRVSLPTRSWLSSLVLFHWLDFESRPARRYAPTYPSVLRASARAHGLVYLALALLGAFVSALIIENQWGPVGWALPLDDTVDVLLLPILLPLIFLAVMFAHESGHLAAVRILGADAKTVIVRGMIVRIVLERAANRGRARIIALTGPLAAVSVGLALSRVLEVVGALDVAVIFAWALGIVHLVNLSPWAGDGKVLFGRSPS